jgi:hypothetical protein
MTARKGYHMTHFPVFQEGDIYLLSPDTYYEAVKPLLNRGGATSKSNFAIMRLDGESGTDAIRPFMSSDLRTGLFNTGRLLARCHSDKLQALGSLCLLYTEALRELECNDPVGAYDDIIMALQPQRLIHVKAQLHEHHSTLFDEWENRIQALCAQVPRCDEYGYLLNVSAHNVIRRWARFGGADNRTRITNEIDMTKINIIIDYAHVPDESMRETGEDPMIPVMEDWLSMLSPYNEDSSLHIDTHLSERYSTLKAQGFTSTDFKELHVT